MRFKLVNSTVRHIYDTHHLNIIYIISYFNIFPFFEHYYHYTIYAIVLIRIHRTAGPFTFYGCCYLQYIFCLQYRYNRNYLQFSFDSIAYSSNNTGEHRIFIVNIHTCKCTILILGILRFGLSHMYTIQNNTG